MANAAAEEGTLRVATYNVALYRAAAGQLAADLASGTDAQARQIAEVIQRVRPDILLLCEIDQDSQKHPATLFAERYLAVGQAGQLPIDYRHIFQAPVNTGYPSGRDLNRNQQTTDPEDAWGYGRYPGQYGMAVLSRWPIDTQATRTFQRLPWSTLPNARRPVLPSGESYYDDATWAALRLPSKSLWDVVVRVPNDRALHLICSHPTPPVFDGPEDRNGCRNADEVRLVREYTAGQLPDYFVDDRGQSGSLSPGAEFVVLGDLNADPLDGSGQTEAIRRLLSSPSLAKDPRPRSVGAIDASQNNASLNADHQADPTHDTGDFGRDGHGNLRIDYALPSAGLRVVGSGVFWPVAGEPGAEAAAASDHRLVWVDLSLEETSADHSPTPYPTRSEPAPKAQEQGSP
ncbi:endonuclease/exonuclease/phosphatase family protein [Botrimarina hoheduenensis]|uniref:endonuclease/exonuclease/phosphatase family protein n=1 Tax=Botrimarina hoheduenensis TaxID=2528000 RepID=UPI001E59FB54|nr:endonuclease/exonuclease/phosphatase family protein [Botrimarina hoheduenensis]